MIPISCRVVPIIENLEILLLLKLSVRIYDEEQSKPIISDQGDSSRSASMDILASELSETGLISLLDEQTLRILITMTLETEEL
jgi:hypothetical protein